ncbi:hypothetical protein PLCT1_00866 [Planctomycetaceae bacterium]|nr:hypothetical protein PLCT1_00866 [Planctomycetaceae bacterium]
MRLTLLLLATLALSASLHAATAPAAYTVTASAISGGYTSVGGTTLNLGDDALSTAISPSGFSVSYFGASYTSFKVCSNGFIILGSAGTITDRSPTTGLGKTPGLTIAPCWYDLKPNAGGTISWSFVGGVLAIEYKAVDATGPFAPQITTITAKILINATTGVIEFHYGTGNLKSVIAGTVSIAGPSGASQSVIYGVDGANVSATGELNNWPAGRLIRFSPAVATPVNQPPTLAVTANSTPVTNGSSLNVSHNSMLSALVLKINVADPNSGDTVSVAASITNIGTTGIAVSEFQSGLQAAPYVLSPVSGTFNAASTTHVVSLVATDNSAANAQFTFNIVVGAQPNTPCAIAVSATSGTVTNGGSVNVNFGATLASLALQITVSDADGNNCTLNGTVSNLGGTGIVQSEFSRASAATPYNVNPTSGTFNTVAGITHTVSLTANDGTVNTTFTFDIVQAPQPPAPLIDVREGSLGGTVIANGAASGGSRDFGSRDINLGATASLSIFVVNNGSAALNIGTPTLTGDVGDFVVSIAGMSSTIGAGQSTSFSIAFDPASIGTKNATVSFTHNDASTTNPFTFGVTGNGTQPGPLTITTTSLTDATVGVPYSAALQATGGYPGYTWTITAGNLPAGLALAGGQITGTCTGAAGNYPITVQVTDTQSNTQTQNLSIQVLPAGAFGGNSVGGSGGGGCAAQSGSSWLGMIAVLGLLAMAGLRRRNA